MTDYLWKIPCLPNGRCQEAQEPPTRWLKGDGSLEALQMEKLPAQILFRRIQVFRNPLMTICGNPLDYLLSQWNMSGSSGTTHKVIGRRQQSWRSLNWVIGEKQSYQLSLQLSSLTKWETPESPKDDLKKTAVFMHLKRSNWTWLL